MNAIKDEAMEVTAFSRLIGCEAICHFTPGPAAKTAFYAIGTSQP
jgi:hypothetical protein